MNESQDRIIVAAQKRGSTAKTRAGAWRYLRHHRPQPLPPHDWEGCPPMGREAWDRSDHDRRLEAAQIVVPLGPQDRDKLVTWAYGLYPRRKNWTGTEARVGAGRSVETLDCGRYSSRCTYTHYKYRPTMASWAIIWRDGRRLEYHHEDDTFILEAPHGYYWDRDDNGLRLVSRARDDDDYHFNSDDLRDYSKRAIRAQVLDNARLRAAERREWRRTQSQIRRAESEGAHVCLADSVRAGNCRVGSEGWARRYGLDPRGHYRPSELLRRANGDGARVRLAVVAALRRHHTEMRQGYSVLADHTY